MLEFACPRCGRSVRVEEELRGRATVCKRCGESIAVPDSAAVSPDDFNVISADEVRQSRKQIDLAQRIYNRLRISLILAVMAGMTVGAGFGAVGWSNLEATGICMAGAIIGLVLGSGAAALFNVMRAEKRPTDSLGEAVGEINPIAGLLVAAALSRLEGNNKPRKALDTTGDLIWIVLGMSLLGAGLGAEMASRGYPRLRGPFPDYGGWIGAAIGGLVLGALCLGGIAFCYRRR